MGSRMIYKAMAVFVMIVLMCGSLFADEKKVQGVDLVTDAAAAIVTKAFAILSGNLEVTMAADNGRIKNKNNYTEDAIGQMVPKSTVTK